MSLLALHDIEVRFGGVVALRDFSLAIQPGNIHGLIGPNGAGKTTAINVMTGLVRPVAGHMEFEGAPFAPRARDLVGRRVSRSFQTPSIFGDLSALENVMVGGYSLGRSGFVRGSVRTPGAIAEERALTERAKSLLDRAGFAGDLYLPARAQSFASQRKMEIARVLMSDPKLLFLDEPTAGLSQGEVTQFAAFLRSLCSDHSMTILLVEHNVPFVFGLCDDVTAMSGGRAIKSGTPEDVRRDEAVVESYLGPRHGAAVDAESRRARTHVGGAVVLDLHDVISGYGATTILRDVNLQVGAGEAVALFGRNGAGKSTLLNTILGSPRAKSGTIRWNGTPIERMSTDRIVREGIGLVPQDRAVIVGQSVEDNLDLATFGLRLSSAERAARRDELLARFPRLAERRTQLGGSLSGGERQMLAIAKVLMRKPQLLMLDEPSIGLAPQIVEELAEIVAQLRDEGLPIVIAEQNVTWVIPIADRAYLIDTGKIVAEGPPSELAADDMLVEHYLGV
jgi:ABC-type branched-subunit amino acid transport system ATPase component